MVPQVDLLRFVLRQETHEVCMFCCPVCGSDEVQLGAIEVEQGHVRAVLFEDHAVVAPTDRSERADGSCTRLQLRCARGHLSEYGFAYSAGQVLVNLKVGRDVVPFPELWRGK